MTVVGELALWVALFLAVWGGVASFAGAAASRPELVDSAVRSIVAAAGMTTLASVGLWSALLGHDFSLQYVASHTTVNTPTLYLLTAFWAGSPGALLSFALAMSLCSAAIVFRWRRGQDEYLARVVGALASALTLVLLAVCFLAYPYDRAEWVPAEGQGLDPRLQWPLATAYYVATYAACGAAAVPFALAVGAAAARRADTAWLTPVRGWSLATWCSLTIGIAVRTRWTYLEPAAGGFWQADLAQAATLGAWIAGLALLRRFAVRGGARAPRRVAWLALALFGFAFIGAVAVPRSPGSRDRMLGSPSETLLALAALAILATVAIYWVRRLPALDARGGLGTSHRSAGLLVSYAGIVILLAGAAARSWWMEQAINLGPGETAELTDPFRRRWRFVSQGVSRDERINYLSTGVGLEVWRDGETLGIVSAERRQYIDSMQRPTYEPVPWPGVRSSLGLDIYVVLAEVRGEVARLRVRFHPLAAWVWIGWVVILTGGLALGTGPGGQQAARNDVAGARAA